jgi:hypothetical protein
MFSYKKAEEFLGIFRTVSAPFKHISIKSGILVRAADFSATLAELSWRDLATVKLG